MTEDLSMRAAPFAIYTPSIQTHSAIRIASNDDLREDGHPKRVQSKDFNFLNPNNRFWHYKWVLATAGHFKDEHNANAVTTKQNGAFVLGDSGGFQIGKGSLKDMKGWARLRKKPQQIIALWRKTEVKADILKWLDLHCDYAMTIDMPLWARRKENERTPFHYLSEQELLDISVENLEYFDTHRGKYGSCKFLNVLQGEDETEEELWYQTVKGFKFEGWSLAGGVGQMGGIYRVLRRMLLLRDDKLLDKGYDWVHILRLSRMRWAPLMTAVQNGVRKSTGNETFRVSFDSSSPYQTGGVAAKYATLNTFGKNLQKEWSLGSKRIPTGYGYANLKKRMPLNRVHKGHLDVPLDSPIAKLLSVNDLNVRGHDRMAPRNLDAFSDEVILNHNVYIYCFGHILANEAVFSKNPTAPQMMMDAVGVIEELFKVEDWNSLLDKKRNFLANVAKDPKRVWKP
jgi:hypothetical protein